MKKPLESHFTINGIFHTGEIAKYIKALEDYIEYLENKPLGFKRIDEIPHLPYLDKDEDVDLPPKKI